VPIAPHDIIDYWFAEPVRKRWFRSTPDLDAQIGERFGATWQQAAGGAIIGRPSTAEELAYLASNEAFTG
jgi:uncharacterized protein (DUF924 family)